VNETEQQLALSRFDLIADIENTRNILLDWGWSLLPIPHRQKHPDGAWKQYQTRLATKEEMDAWFNVGIGVVCGTVSKNLVCLDFDEQQEYDRWMEANKELAARLPTS
jgi:hypothetical protein